MIARNLCPQMHSTEHVISKTGTKTSKTQSLIGSMFNHLQFTHFHQFSISFHSICSFYHPFLYHFPTQNLVFPHALTYLALPPAAVPAPIHTAVPMVTMPVAAPSSVPRPMAGSIETTPGGPSEGSTSTEELGGDGLLTDFKSFFLFWKEKEAIFWGKWKKSAYVLVAPLSTHFYLFVLVNRFCIGINEVHEISWVGWFWQKGQPVRPRPHYLQTWRGFANAKALSHAKKLLS